MTPPRHLAIDAVGAKHSGAATVLKAVVAAALRNPHVGRLTLFCSPASERSFELPADGKLSAVSVPLGERGPAGRLAWQYVGLPALARRQGADILLCMSGGGAAPAGTPGVLLVQQSLPFCKEAMATLAIGQRLRARALRWSMRYAARRSVAVAVQSPTMARWVAERLGLELERVRVFEPCVTLAAATIGAPELAPMREFATARFLYVGNGSAYKNLGVLGRAMERLNARSVGARLFVTIPPKHPLLAVPGVDALGRLPMPVLSEAYGLATAVVMPSLVETVGLPMLEAAAAGTAVVAADRPYAHDTCGDAAVYFDPLDPGDLVRKLDALMTDEGLRAELVKRGRERAAKRAAAKPYERLIDLLLQLARSSS